MGSHFERSQTVSDRDGIFERQGTYWMSYIDHTGKRRQEKLKGVHSKTTARHLRELKLAKVKEARLVGYVEPTKDTFADFAPRYLKHQKVRLTSKAYGRTEGIVQDRLQPVFGATPLASIRKADVQRYLTDRLEDVS